MRRGVLPILTALALMLSGASASALSIVLTPDPVYSPGTAISFNDFSVTLSGGIGDTSSPVLDFEFSNPFNVATILIPTEVGSGLGATGPSICIFGCIALGPTGPSSYGFVLTGGPWLGFGEFTNPLFGASAGASVPVAFVDFSTPGGTPGLGTLTVVPEPSLVLLFTVGLGSIAAVRRRTMHC